MDIKKRVLPHLLNISPYVPGKPIQEVQRELGLTDVIKLASNENVFGTSQKVIEAICKAAPEINYYPDGGCFYLREAIAKRFGVKSEQVVVGNGVDELIRLICVSMLGPNDEVVFADPSFVMYKISSMVANATLISVPLKDKYYHDIPAMLDKITERTKLLFVCNPNNPTGTIVNKADVELLMKKVPDHVMVVFDEAYYEYVANPDYPQTMEYFKSGRQIAVFRTFSKVYGLAGLRVGYGFVPEDLADVIHRVRNPFNVNELAQVAALAALDDPEHMKKVIALNAAGRKQLSGEFDRLGLKYAPSDSNFILVDVERDSQAVFEALLKKGVIVRPGKFLGFPTCLRVSIAGEKDNARFIEALTEVLA
ncbi:MAG TPA: histidinol-phosphate transaminase [bacterium]|nr:histidinol-phosphate transaminase [bacterium]